MHGVILWNRNGLEAISSRLIGDSSSSQRSEFSVPKSDASHLITWEDARCSPEFLSTLPKSEFGDISSGFGCASLFLLARHVSSSSSSSLSSSHSLMDYEAAGTLADFMVAVLTHSPKSGSTIHTVPMTTHNAASW